MSEPTMPDHDWPVPIPLKPNEDTNFNSSLVRTRDIDNRVIRLFTPWHTEGPDDWDEDPDLWPWWVLKKVAI